MYNLNSSKCPNCQKTGFELNTENPKDSNFKINIVRCISCKTAIGVVDYHNAGILVKKLAQLFGKNLD